MNIKLLVIGKTVSRFLQEGIEEYTKRLKFYVKFELDVIADVKNAKNFSKDQLKEAEGDLILAAVDNSDTLVLLDEGGKERTSIEFAKYTENFAIKGVKRVVFVVGGAYGFSQKVYQRANEKVSLSKMTFSHQMVRLIFVEQLYRAHTIIKGEPYHHQ